jgi:magnesium-transporting ATPase (P-type)
MSTTGFADGLLPPEKYNESYEYTPEKPEFLNIGLRFVGLLSLIDPPRAAIPDAVRKCRAAGLKVVMITGDHPTTAMAVGRVAGIISEKSETRQELAHRKNLPVDAISPANAKAMVITGSELKRMNHEQLDAAISSSKELIFARANPEQKYMIIEAFQRLGHFVTVAGDGVNDSPALKKADIGISMGITGTEVSKAISDLILLDDNFTSIVHGVEEGRKGFESLKRILRYTLADNMAEMYSFCVCIILGVPLPLGTMAILLTVLGTDILPASSLMYELPEIDVMRLKPRDPKKERLITPQYVDYMFCWT